MGNLILGDNIEDEVKKPQNSVEWLESILESITEELFTQTQIDSLLDNPIKFIEDYTDDYGIASEIYNQIVSSYFTSTVMTKERSKDKREVLRKFALDRIDEMLLDNTGSISAVDLSIIYKNIKKEN